MNESEEKIRQLSQRFFEEELKHYGDVVPPSGQDDSHLVNLLKILADGKKCFSLLDIGCGIGYVAKTVKTLYPRSKVFGIDISPKIIAKAKKADSSKSIRFDVGKEIDFPYENNSFDFAVCRFSIHHYPQIIQHFQEVYRVLKEEGIYLIIDVLPDIGLYDKWLNDLFIAVERKTAGHVKFYTLNEYESFIRKSHFTIQKVEYFPLVLDFPKSNPFFEQIKNRAIRFQQLVAFQEQENSFSFRMKAAGIYVRKNNCI